MQHLSGLLDYETMALHADPASPTAPSLTRTKPRHSPGGLRLAAGESA